MFTFAALLNSTTAFHSISVCPSTLHCPHEYPGFSSVLVEEVDLPRVNAGTSHNLSRHLLLQLSLLPLMTRLSSPMPMTLKSDPSLQSLTIVRLPRSSMIKVYLLVSSCLRKSIALSHLEGQTIVILIMALAKFLSVITMVLSSPSLSLVPCIFQLHP